MAGEEQYINPIIQSMFQTAQNSQKAKEITEQARRNKAEETLRQQQLAQENTRIENEHQYQIDMLKTHHDQLANEINQSKIHSIGILNDLASRGIDLTKVFQGGQPQAGLPSTGNVQSPGSTVSVPGLGDISPDAFTSPEQALQLKENEIRGTTQAQQEALQPTKILDFNREMLGKEHLMDVQKTYDKELKQIELNFQEHKGTLDRASQEKIAQIHTGPEYTKLNLEYGAGAPQLVQGLTHGLLTGQIPSSETQPLIRNIGAKAMAEGAVLPQKGDWNALRQSEKVLPLIDKIKAFANKYLPSEAERGGFGAKAQAYVQGTVGAHTAIPTDAKNEYNQIMSQVLMAGQQLDGVSGGRYPLGLINKVAGGLTDMGITREQALEKADNLQNVLKNTREALMTGMPDFQRKEFYVSGITPNFLIGAAPTRAKEPLNKEESIRLGYPSYGKYDEEKK